MWRALATTMLAATAVACSSTTGEQAPPAPPLDPARVGPAAIEAAAATEAVVSFLDAYARNEEDHDVIGEMVDGPALRDWAYWFAVQNAGLQDRLAGRVRLRNLRVLGIEESTAEVAIDAAVVFEVSSEEGPSGSVARTFDSPILLSRPAGDPLAWRVLDARRDGRSMRDSITLFDEIPAVAEKGGIEVEVRSLYRFSSGTVVNMRVSNRGDEPIAIEAGRSLLQLEGRPIAAGSVTQTLKAAIRPGEHADGALNFPPVDLTATPEVVSVAFARGAEPVGVGLPPEAYVSGILSSSFVVEQ